MDDRRHIYKLHTHLKFLLKYKKEGGTVVHIYPLTAFQGVTFPSMNCMLATWILPKDRSMFSTIVYSGFQIGTVIGLYATGWLCNFKYLEGWPLPFYTFGGLGIAWAITWYCIIYERPEDHPGIPNAELRQLILNYESRKQAEVLPMPWRGMLTSLTFWAVVASSLGNDYGFFTLLTELPTYLHDVQHFNIENNGALSALPYFLMWIFGLLWAALMDYLTKKETLALVNIRRLSTGVALYGPMIGLIAMCFVNCNAILATSVLCIFGMLNGAVNSGYLCSHQDIAPNLAGTLLGITNTVGALAGIAAPAITSYIIEDKASAC
ncbi:hypothetical protein SK128_021598 [Halocaridina rubra]|uniref:Inorganic phosphate cotransporter n=1 Tax=Halocaridina rubra TaxID=373956 RepID=A0AAN8XAG8_HALRR